MWQREIRVTSATNVNGVPVAEFALGLVLMCLRDVFGQVVRFRERGRAGWAHGPLLAYYGNTVGIIGMGNVGKHLLKLLGVFQFKKLVHSFYPFEEQAAVAGAECMEILRVDGALRRRGAACPGHPCRPSPHRRPAAGVVVRRTVFPSTRAPLRSWTKRRS